MEQTIGKRIMKNRKRLGLTQDQLAEQLGVTAQAVSKWENDQSCPDITILPKLAEIFGTTTDALLGCAQESQAIEAEVVEENESNGLHIQNGNWEFSWDGGRKNALGLAVLALCVGALYLLTQIFMWGLSFWDILWPTTLVVFGLFGLFPKFSVFRLGCVLVAWETTSCSGLRPPWPLVRICSCVLPPMDAAVGWVAADRAVSSGGAARRGAVRLAARRLGTALVVVP